MRKHDCESIKIFCVKYGCLLCKLPLIAAISNHNTFDTSRPFVPLLVISSMVYDLHVA